MKTYIAIKDVTVNSVYGTTVLRKGEIVNNLIANKFPQYVELSEIPEVVLTLFNDIPEEKIKIKKEQK